MGAGIAKRRHRRKMNTQRRSQIDRGRVHKSKAHKRRAKLKGIWSPNPGKK